MKEHVWIVEGAWDIRGTLGPWLPVAGIGLDRAQGRAVMQDWKRRNPFDHFRLRKYVKAKP